jgi:uncharacterized membrane-anchored protein
VKIRLFLAVAVLQVLVLAFMAGQREWISRTGLPVTLRTAPIDPDDPMRGAYVHLDYEISQVPAALCQGGPAKWIKVTDYREQQGWRDRVVYAALQVTPHGIAELVSLSDVRPARGPFLRGRVESVSTEGVRVRYGIEALFMAKAAAQQVESMVRKEKAGAPIDAQIAVGSSGISVLKGYEWEPLGLTLAFDRPPLRPATNPPQPWQQPTLAGLTVTLHNYGDRDLAIVDLPEGKSFRLVPNRRAMAGHYAWVGDGNKNQPEPRAAEVFVLKPGATHACHLDLTQPPWWITDTNKPGASPLPLQKVPDGWMASFRIEYAPPAADACRGLPSADLIRHVPLRSRAFNANQGVD